MMLTQQNCYVLSQSLEAEADSMGETNCELQTALAYKEQQLQQQRGIIVDLEATINAQSSDIRTALQLVRAQFNSIIASVLT